MAGRLNADPDQVRNAAGIAQEIRDRLQRMAHDARSAVAPGESAWGDDDFGGKFANGAKGFVTGSDNLTTGTDNLANSFDNLKQGLDKSAKDLDAMEHGNHDNFA
ncbi:WXG100 family type VII secretion target [Nocardia heshunensis]